MSLARLSIVSPSLGFASVTSGTLLGLELQPIRVEVALRRGPGHFELAGLAETSVREARIRVGTALGRLGVLLEEYAITVSLAPATLRKGGGALDLAIALSILGAVGKAELPNAATSFVVGELALDGRVRPVPGVLPLLEGARRAGFTDAYVPAENAAEASRVRGLAVRPVSSLVELIAHLDQSAPIAPCSAPDFVPKSRRGPDVADVRGQGLAKRALLIAAAGHHHLLFVGPPGSGKSLLARRLPGLLPRLSLEQALEVTSVFSVSGLLDRAEGIVDQPPFRAPHHTVSDAGLVGGGTWPRPGEMSLAHRGVLFLDELPEFRRSALEALREPLEEGVVRVTRARGHAEFPARPLLVAAMNPCPCGHHKSAIATCRCRPEQRQRYLGKLSGPLLDRIDLQVVVQPAPVATWMCDRAEPSQLTTTALGARVEEARAIQTERCARGHVRARENGLLELDELERVARPSPRGSALLARCAERLGLSARGFVRVLRVARTLADLDGGSSVEEHHVAEAISLRTFDPNGTTQSQVAAKEAST